MEEIPVCSLLLLRNIPLEGITGILQGMGRVGCSLSEECSGQQSHIIDKLRNIKLVE